ncbi:MAG: PQQ-binding-like beta-propeller repeat protein [Candidatus Bathyarchaeota archaeon]|nr:PQQ-binding-like beta-propeller repeat protein [Candidatus Bathyarchaeota archaeon]
MNISKTKLGIALFLTLTMAVSFVALPLANAHDPAWKIPTYAFINVAPNPVGVGQYVNVIMWIDKCIEGANWYNNIRFRNYKLTITDPDGHVETKTWDVCIDTTSSQYYRYTPQKTGTYTFKFEFPEQTYDFGGAYNGDIYLASSAITTLKVQEEQITTITSYPLPNEYWTRPIYGENTDWWSISSNWLGEGGPQTTASFSGYQVAVPDAVGSQTSHIMWTLPLQSGGVVGGDMFPIQGQTYFEGTAYIPRYTNPIIVDGMLIYTTPISFGNVDAMSGSGTYGPTVCRDLRTGKLLWSKSQSEMGKISFALIFDVQNPNQHGVYQPIIVSVSGSTWYAYDAYSGTKLFTAINVPTGTEAMGPNGEYLKYVVANAGTDAAPDYRLCQWNSSKLWYGASGEQSIIGGTVDASIWSGDNVRYDWNVSLPWLTQAASQPDWMGQATAMQAHAAKYNDLILCHNGTLPSGGGLLSPISWTPYNYFAINLNPDKGTIGSLRWIKEFTQPSGNITVGFGGCDFESRVWLQEYKETTQWVGYDMDTGEKLWGPTKPQESGWDYYGIPGVEDRVAMMAYDKVYVQFFSGILYCYDAHTGDLLWTYGNGGEGNCTASGYYGGYGVYPTAIAAIGNGVIYMVTTEHTVSTPIYKGAMTRAINATDGTEIWKLSSFTNSFHTMSYAIADGFSTWWNGYDNSIYVAGRGPSATTVTAPDVAVSFGTPVVIKGTVMDISTGTTQDEQAARFPNGVPAVSDKSMTDWMGYVYQQRPRPTNVTGVEVTISVLDSNNNYREIGTATTDADGFFSFEWKPDIPGKFTVYATFAGTNGYWPSHDVTAFTVTEAPESTPPPTPVPQAPVETYFTVSTIVIIAAIAIVGVLLLRKR